MAPTRFEGIASRMAERRLTRRQALTRGSAGVAAVGLAAAGLTHAAIAQDATPAAAPAVGPGTAADQQTQAAAIVALAREAMAKYSLKAVIVRVTVAGQELVTAALGDSMTGVLATADMHFRNGAVAISYLSTLLLRLVDQKKVGLDDPLAKWMTTLPDADRVTFRMLANMTAGYPDYVQNPQLVKDLYADPFKQWTSQELIDIGLSTPRIFAPGANWDYSHTNYVILGQALEQISGQPMAALMQEQILKPLGLKDTQSFSTAEIPDPVLHAFSSERREALGIPAAMRFYEESTYWNPSWSIAQGAIQTTNISDMTATAVAVGTGTLLSPASHEAQVAPSLLGFGSPLKGCPSCHTLDRTYNSGLGVVLTGAWILQNPLFGGYGSIEAYLPSKQIAVAVATTYDEPSFDEQGNYKFGNASQQIFAAIGAYLAPEDAPPAPKT